MIRRISTIFAAMLVAMILMVGSASAAKVYNCGKSKKSAALCTKMQKAVVKVVVVDPCPMEQEMVGKCSLEGK